MLRQTVSQHQHLICISLSDLVSLPFFERLLRPVCEPLRDLFLLHFLDDPLLLGHELILQVTVFKGDLGLG